MDDKTRQLIIWMTGAVALTFAFVLYQGMVVQPQAALDAAEKVRLDGIEYSKTQKMALSFCLESADTSYWKWIDINMTTKDDGTYWGSNYNWDKADAKKKTDEDACYRQYSNK